ncbi:damage-inducible protein DinB [Epilithonimonas sp. JDS]|uniref:DinB family protein n=1 Tax=Epilithonimonas sp. JDS TaxID=2902797 RepID=UPI001E29B821|nr:DinB family protein [Epilithonimonas sp. JDS]MCD9855951.1 damage-inducible protein DinB [Epilithonimonas sp. JDS]
MMKKNFQDYLEYNQHFNQSLIQNYLENKLIWGEKSKSLLNHILNAHQIWNARILNDNQFEVWQINADDSLIKINSENFINSSKILAGRDITEIINYQNSKGKIFENSIQEIFFHFINHSTYHRGQIATLMKENGLEPLNTDYIFYKRF